jgi:hypothetical protein
MVAKNLPCWIDDLIPRAGYYNDDNFVFHVTSQGEGLIEKLHELRRHVALFLALDGLNELFDVT